MKLTNIRLENMPFTSIRLKDKQVNDFNMEANIINLNNQDMEISGNPKTSRIYATRKLCTEKKYCHLDRKTYSYCK